MGVWNRWGGWGWVLGGGSEGGEDGVGGSGCGLEGFAGLEGWNELMGEGVGGLV